MVAETRKSLNVQEVADKYSVSKLTVYNWIKRGWIASKKVGKFLMIDKTSLDSDGFKKLRSRSRIKAYVQGLLCPECSSETLLKAGHSILKRERTQRYICDKCNRLTHKPIVRG